MHVRIAVLALLSGSGLVAAGTAPPAREPLAVRRLEDAADGAARIGLHRATGVARFVSLRPGALILEGATPQQRATDFFVRHGRAFGVTDAARQLRAAGVTTDPLGATRVTQLQVHDGVPVFAGILHAHFDPAGRIVAVNGTFVPGIAVDTLPAWSAAAASARALAAVAADRPDPPAMPLATAPARLVVYRSGLVQRVAGRDHLAWEIEVGNGHDVRERVLVDAHTGKILERFPGVHDVIERRIHEGAYNDVVIWSEGDPLPYSSGNAGNDGQVNGLIAFAADIYDVVQALSGGTFPSWDGLDGTLHSVWKSTSIACPNASWNGTTTNYCDGVASDDVVAHEWAHAYTERTHGLIYAWQPGALNESYSDVFGEIVDTLNGAGTDTPAPPRVPGDCSTFGGSPPPLLEVWAPATIAGSYGVAGASFNPDPPIAATAPLELVDDGSGDVTDACEPLVGFTAGRIAVVHRGNCNFSLKAQRVQNAGATGMIVVNTQDSVFNMSGSNPAIVIPSVMVASSDGQTIEAQLGLGVTATVELDAATAPSVRWLNGEDAFGFGGPIRDLWNPTCFGDPGRVSDPQYWCTTGDGGGVHTNSGIPNHAFALIVDGGSYNGRTVAGLGLTKAAHLYWRAMSVYQVPDTDFADHADALAQSCQDLLGVNLADPGSGAPSGQVLTPFDCAELDEAIAATELAEVPPCEFAPLLAADAPPFACGAVAFADGFESDPAGVWTRTNQGVFPEYEPRDWVWTSDVPAGGSGAALFAISSLEIGNCIEGDNDQSGAMFLESPSIVLGGEASLAFRHWVATEPSFDGGNLEISVDGGPYQLVSGDAFLFNRYNAVLESAANGNTNPLAGEEAFSGSDGGSVNGSWGESQVDLGLYADAGDTIRLRFDFGVDGCNGLQGWYVDDVRVCTAENGAGRVPNGATVPGPALTLAKAGSDLVLAWGDSCTVGDEDYAVYEGTLGSFASHAPRQCSTLGATSTTLAPSAGSHYYLVVPRSADREGSYGTDSSGNPRPPAASPCLPQALAPPC
jgi:Zn-dependent metalloprotease